MVYLVALFTRAWIEIAQAINDLAAQIVALFTRAWIEIELLQMEYDTKQSPSSRGRGLKCYAYYITFEEAVAAYYSMSRNSRIVLIRDKGFGNVYFELKYVEICIKYSALLDIRCAVC